MTDDTTQQPEQRPPRLMAVESRSLTRGWLGDGLTARERAIEMEKQRVQLEQKESE